MLIRAANEDDWALLRQIRLDALCDAPTAFGVSHATAAANSDTQWRDRASGRGPAYFVLALVNGVAVGLAGGVISASAEPALIAMWVRPAHRGAAVAAGLVGAIKQWAVGHGHERLVLSVSPDNERAAAFYRKQGFRFLPEWEVLESDPQIQLQKMVWQAAS
ncbi:GNAT family N-acetyltransferase [Massilia psychrophila]|uniref:GNAT family N-acetyltransferase n=1 Tax=Massilia psychrophila TaxID=1603353 RepID=A0A2G8SWG7_9BURK|nr:GNAT family N-acetyltransferase [Massilia psychrophila]PIL38082.1 GNAT family N-acetyltransferase [Massilia psychrophila]GGE88053.1 N-acetyltransferase [Massilia psychrophila]